MSRRDSISITPSGAAPAAARAFLGRFAAAPSTDLARLRLAASELVTAAVRLRSEPEPVRITASEDEGVVRVEVEAPTVDWSSGIHEQARRVLTGVCDRWGIAPSPPGAVGWFEITIEAAADGEYRAGSS